jgi:O-antigen ligase
VTIRAEADLERQWISDLSWKLLPSAGVLGIGYGNFMLHYAREHPDTNVQSIHNVYVAWLLEGGYAGLAAGLFMVGWFFWWLSVGYRTSNTDDQRRFLKAIGISMVGVLTAAILQQMHQAPMLYVTLGLGMGAVRSIHRTAGLKTIRSSGHLPRSSINVHSSAT